MQQYSGVYAEDGSTLDSLIRKIGARQVFELGSGYGYSTAWFDRAVKENGGGTAHHVVWDEDLSPRAKALASPGVRRDRVLPGQ